MATSNRIRLSQIVNDYLLSRDQEDFDAHVTRQKVMLHAKNVLKDLTRKTGGGGIKSIIVPVTNYTAILPPDFMDYTKIGVMGADGNVVAMGRNDSLGISHSVLTDNLGNDLLDQDGYQLTSRPTRSGSASIQDWAEGGIWMNYWHGDAVFNMYGASGISERHGTYRVDYENEFVEFSTDMGRDEIILEYISDPTLAPDPLVDQRLEDAIKAGVYYKNIQRKANVPDNHREYARREWYNERRKANDRIQTFTIYEAVKALKATDRPVKF